MLESLSSCIASPFICLLVSSHTIVQHSLHQKTMSVSGLITPFSLEVQAVWPEVSASATDGGGPTILALQQRSRRRPVVVVTMVVEGLPLTDAECVSDLMKGRPLCLISWISPKA